MKQLMTAVLALLLILFIAGSVHAQHFTPSMMAKTVPDECFDGIGNPYPPGPPCGVGEAKVNDSYIWSSTLEGNLWVGTAANVLCTTSGAFLGELAGYEPGYFVCEYEESQIVNPASPLYNPFVPDELGDWRPSRIYEYDLATDILIEHTPLPAAAQAQLETVLGLRSAGSHNGVVFFAGETLARDGVVIFAFDADTGEFLGWNKFTQYVLVRKWLVVNDILYTGMGQAPGGAVRSHILRWSGNKSNLWDFQVVGQLNGGVVELAEYIDGNNSRRIAATTTGATNTGLWISPPIYGWFGGGLAWWQRWGWRRIWTPAVYEPDTITRQTYGGGALAYFDGWLYFGTMHIPGFAAYTHSECGLLTACFGTPLSPAEFNTLIEGTRRATTIWRARNLESFDPEIQLLYGEAQLPAYNAGTRSFPLVNNVGGWVPLYGSSGFNNIYNSYSWTMRVVDGRLLVGTFDSSILFSDDPDPNPYGADLWRFDSSAGPAVEENLSGLGNPFNYGFRTITVSDDGTKAFVGTANPFNLHPWGGWELRELSP